MKIFLELTSLALFVMFFFISCNKAEDIINPTHYARVPRAVNLSVSYDTTNTSKYKITLNWGVESTYNLKDFEIYRSTNQINYFFLVGGITATNYVDSSLSITNDTLKLGYFVNGRGIDRFVGQSSDTIKITVTKTF